MNLIFLQVRPQFRPSIRRTTTASSRPKPTNSNLNLGARETTTTATAAATTQFAVSTKRRRPIFKQQITTTTESSTSSVRPKVNRRKFPTRSPATTAASANGGGAGISTTTPRATTSNALRSQSRRRQTTVTTTAAADFETTTRSFRRRFSTQPRKQFNSTPFTYAPETTTQPPPAPTTINPPKLNKFGDQAIGFSVVQQQNQFSNHRYNQIGELLEPDEKILEAFKHIAKAPVPYTVPFTATESISRSSQHFNPTTTPAAEPEPETTLYTTNPAVRLYENSNSGNYNNLLQFFDQTQQSSAILTTPSPRNFNNYQSPTPKPYNAYPLSSSTERYTNVLHSDISTTVRPRKQSLARYRKPEAFEKIEPESYSYRSDQSNAKRVKAPTTRVVNNGGSSAGRTYRPVNDYDYYDDGDTQHVGKVNSQIKVILHGPGVIECLDQGNFPHPLSCRKFISCAKMETGGVVGWEYTCPKNLSYDPVGGICNWSAGLGCKE